MTILFLVLTVFEYCTRVLLLQYPWEECRRTHDGRRILAGGWREHEGALCWQVRPTHVPAVKFEIRELWVVVANRAPIGMIL